MKFPFLKDLGREKGSVRVGPLGRMNVTNSLSTPLAQEALERFHAYTGGAANNMTLHTNWARTIEVLHAAELIEELLRDPDLQKQDLLVTPAADAWVGEGVGVVEAPRGTLLHHYRAGPEGDITFANLIVATTHNNQVLNRTVRSVAEDYLEGRGEITEAMMNAIEVGIRAYDPCLSCATHAFGQMPLMVTVYDAGGKRDQRAHPFDIRFMTLDDFDNDSCLIYGIGNVGRQDDGLGWAFVDWLQAEGLCSNAEMQQELSASARGRRTDQQQGTRVVHRCHQRGFGGIVHLGARGAENGLQLHVARHLDPGDHGDLPAVLSSACRKCTCSRSEDMNSNSNWG